MLWLCPVDALVVLLSVVPKKSLLWLSAALFFRERLLRFERCSNRFGFCAVIVLTCACVRRNDVYARSDGPAVAITRVVVVIGYILSSERQQTRHDDSRGLTACVQKMHSCFLGFFWARKSPRECEGLSISSFQQWKISSGCCSYQSTHSLLSVVSGSRRPVSSSQSSKRL